MLHSGRRLPPWSPLHRLVLAESSTVDRDLTTPTKSRLQQGPGQKFQEDNESEPERSVNAGGSRRRRLVYRWTQKWQKGKVEKWEYSASSLVLLLSLFNTTLTGCRWPAADPVWLLLPLVMSWTLLVLCDGSTRTTVAAAAVEGAKVVNYGNSCCRQSWLTTPA